MTEPTQPKTPAAVLGELVDWSKTLPLWQRDALRRLYQSCSLTETDKSELLTLCRHSSGLLATDARVPTAEPLSKDHVPGGPTTSETVTIASISNVKQVNALVADQSLLFSENGLTVVYGDNGAGKSGYSRILKRVCRARASETILPNIYETQEAALASATLKFSVNGKKECCDWSDDTTPPLLLSHVSLFDATCAPVHVGKEYEAAYTPLPLQILQSLANLCKEFREKLKGEKDSLDIDVPSWRREPKFDQQTQAGKILHSVDSNTSIKDVEELAVLRPEERTRLEDLRAQFKQAPDKLIRFEEAKKLRLSQLISRLETLGSTFNDESLTTYKNKIADAEAKSEAALLAATDAFKNEPLPDKIGTEAWRALWTAARNFAKEAYPALEFPRTDKDAVCVLCQQSLQPDAADRFNRFAKFVREDTRRSADAAIDDRNKALKALMATQLGIEQRLQDNAMLKDEIGLPELAKEVRRFYRHVVLRRGRVVKVVKSEEWPSISQMADAPSGNVQGLLDQVNLRINELRTAVDSEDFKRLRSELQELEDRSLLSDLLEDLKREITRKKKTTDLTQLLRLSILQRLLATAQKLQTS